MEGSGADCEEGEGDGWNVTMEWDDGWNERDGCGGATWIMNKTEKANGKKQTGARGLEFILENEWHPNRRV